MKKKELLELINNVNIANQIIRDSSKILSMTTLVSFGYPISLSEDMWFPDIPDLKVEFEVLKKEVKEVQENARNQKDILKNACKCCKHEVRLSYEGDFFDNSQCVLCGKVISSDSCFSWGESINKNIHCVLLPSKYQYDDGVRYEVAEGYDEKQVLKIILKILENKSDEEEIDLVDEFKKLNLPNCKIRNEKPKPEHYILIIGGSNKESLGENSYINSPTYMSSVDFLKYFKNLINLKIEFIVSRDFYKGYECTKIRNENNRDIKFSVYDTIEDLNEHIKKSMEIPYEIIIDASDLSTYEIINNKIVRKKYDLNLNEKFPESHIIEIIDTNSINHSETFEEFFKGYQTPNEVYLCENGENSEARYYSMNQDEAIRDDLDSTCGKIKRKLKKAI